MTYSGSLVMRDGVLCGELRDQLGYRIPLQATLVRQDGRLVRIELAGAGVMPDDLALPGEPGYVPGDGAPLSAPVKVKCSARIQRRKG